MSDETKQVTPSEVVTTQEITKAEVQKEEPVKQPPVITPVPPQDRALFRPQTLGELAAIADIYAKSKLVPNQFDTKEKVFVGMQMAYALGMEPAIAMRQMYVLNGIPHVYGDIPLALVQRSSLLEDMTETQEMNPAGDCISATITLKRVGKSEKTYTLTWAEAVKSNIDQYWDKDEKKFKEKVTYKNFRKRMLQMRIRSLALKDNFADVLNGIAIYEYDYTGDHEDSQNERVVGDPKTDTAKDLNKELEL